MPRQSRKIPQVLADPSKWLNKPIGDLPRAWLNWLAQEAMAETEPEMDLLEDMPPHPIRSREWNPPPPAGTPVKKSPLNPPSPPEDDLLF